jgi:hypothetical protein
MGLYLFEFELAIAGGVFVSATTDCRNSPGIGASVRAWAAQPFKIKFQVSISALVALSLCSRRLRDGGGGHARFFYLRGAPHEGALCKAKRYSDLVTNRGEYKLA